MPCHDPTSALNGDRPAAAIAQQEAPVPEAVRPAGTRSGASSLGRQAGVVFGSHTNKPSGRGGMDAYGGLRKLGNMTTRRWHAGCAQLPGNR